MAIKVQGITVVDDSRNITNVSQFNGYTPASESISISVGSGLNSTSKVISPSTLSMVIA
jgi:hypothetical protein